MLETADVVVIGLGAIGSATLHRLAMRGVKVVGVDQFHPPHNQGSTHGGSRITRLAVAEGAAYVPLVRRSHEIWRELEAQTGETLFNEVGLLVIAEGNGAPSHGQPGFLGSTIEIAEKQGISHELLTSSEIRYRYPQFQVRDGERGYFEPTGGWLSPERCVAVQLDLAKQLGATVRTGETVTAIEPCGDGLAVTTSSGRIEAGSAVLSAGAWLPTLTPAILPRQHVAVHRQTMLWFQAEKPDLYHPARCPVFIWQHGPAETDYLYGFPLVCEADGVKAASERYDGHVTPDAVNRTVLPEEANAMYSRHIAGRLFGITNRLMKSATCLYTVTPDADFIIDRLDGHSRIIIASACSGHGFKHSAAVGEQVAAWALNEQHAPDQSFALDRFRQGVLSVRSGESQSAI